MTNANSKFDNSVNNLESIPVYKVDFKKLQAPQNFLISNNRNYISFKFPPVPSTTPNMTITNIA
jgi:hypothetical protein